MANITGTDIKNTLQASLWGQIPKQTDRNALKGQPYDRELVAAILKCDLNMLKSIEANQYDQANELSERQYSQLAEAHGIKILANPLLLAARVYESNPTPGREAVLTYLNTSSLVTDAQRQAADVALNSNSPARQLLQVTLSNQATPTLGG